MDQKRQANPEKAPKVPPLKRPNFGARQIKSRREIHKGLEVRFHKLNCETITDETKAIVLNVFRRCEEWYVTLEFRNSRHHKWNVTMQLANCSVVSHDDGSWNRDVWLEKA